jgi:hypothetical protein
LCVAQVFPVELDDIQLEGPIRPGLEFYKWLAKNPPLNIPIPDTIVASVSGVHYIKTSSSTEYKDSNLAQHPKATSQEGALNVTHIPADEALRRDDFVLNCIEDYVAHSVPLCLEPEPLEHRIIAVLKKPSGDIHRSSTAPETGGRPVKTIKTELEHGVGPVVVSTDIDNIVNRVHNNSEVLLPQSFHANLLNALDRRLGSFALIQKYVRSKGAKPSIHRVEWKSSTSLDGEVYAKVVSHEGGAYVPYTCPTFLSYSKEEMKLSARRSSEIILTGSGSNKNTPLKSPPPHIAQVQFDFGGREIHEQMHRQDSAQLTSLSSKGMDLQLSMETPRTPRRSRSRSRSASPVNVNTFANIELVRHKSASNKQSKHDRYVIWGFNIHS